MVAADSDFANAALPRRRTAAHREINTRRGGAVSDLKV